MASLAFWIVWGLVAATLLLGWFYFRHYRLTRSPVGVYNLQDIACMMLFIVVAPLLYIWLPLWLAVGLLLLACSSILYFAFEPVLVRKIFIWLLILLLLGLDTTLSLWSGSESHLFEIVNNLLLIIIAVGLSNLWVQSGLKARDAAILGALLAIYDFFATSLNNFTGDLFQKFSGLPLSPLVEWRSGGVVLGIGLGDLVVATAFPLVLLKAFGKTAGVGALCLNFATITILLVLPLHGLFPVMVIVGPLMLVEYLFWINRTGRERWMWQYFEEEALGAGLTTRQL